VKSSVCKERKEYRFNKQGDFVISRTIYIPQQDLPLEERELQYFVEVFGGYKPLIFEKEKWFTHEVYNDFSVETSRLFTLVKKHPAELFRTWKRFGKNPFAFSEKMEVKSTMEKAVLTLNRMMGFSKKNMNIPESVKLKEFIDMVSKRLVKVIITMQSFEKIIPVYNRKDVFLFLCPPGMGKEKPVSFDPDDHQKLATLLSEHQGEFLIKYPHHPDLENLYKGYYILRTGNSLIISNYIIPKG
jgi:hypothetical protein